MLWVGVDVGGTFTDVVVYDQRTSRLTLGKSPSTPDAPAQGVLDALQGDPPQVVDHDQGMGRQALNAMDARHAS